MSLKRLFGINSLKLFIATRLIPDSLYLKILYKRFMGKSLNLKDPQTLNEKIQWMKLYEQRPEYTQWADKYRCRELVSKSIGDEYLVPLLAVYHSVDEISSTTLPKPPFILKNNHDSSGGIVIRNWNDIDITEIKNKLKNNMSRNHSLMTKEKQYKNIEKCIIAEKLLMTASGKIPNDYKFNCFNGRVEFVYVSIDREGKDYRKIYTRDWIPAEFTWTSKGKEKDKFSGPDIPRPENYELMVSLAEKLSERYKYVRIDLYNVDGKIYFGEFTLHHGSGFEPILPEKYDYYYGSLIELDKNV